MTNASVLNWNTIELHYWFTDESHTMNAIVLNKCEYEFLGIAKEIAQTLKVDLEIETEPLGEGGLRSLFKFKAKNKDAIKVGVILYIITNLLGTPLTTAIDELTRMAIQSVFEREEIRQLKEQKKIAELKTGYEVVLVNYYFENDKPIETPEGRRNRQIKEAEKMQLTLF